MLMQIIKWAGIQKFCKRVKKALLKDSRSISNKEINDTTNVKRKR